ncbi:hypothetical protein [Streptomyces malaysiense]|uniref:Proline rich protein membrane protein n=1 Tax=Streptomyces malaysiense TaxID=1428626 RepID=A0A1J4PZE0_9ACTN|nr:hypothetical protein [Streptomyces malaysiense]OIK26121.1 hypothetical protein VT52_017770 [Streptomyces malaysiense]
MRTRVRVRGWRWRSNPLRRRCDVVEAWTVLVAAVLLFVVVPLTGVAAGLRAQDRDAATAAAQRAARHRVSATLSAAPPAVRVERGHPRGAEIHWTEPGSGTRTAWARVPAGARTGDTVPVWVDSRGRVVAAPSSGAAVLQHAVTVGVCAAACAGGVVFLGCAVVRRIALRHRLAEWERAWARTGPRWTQPRA